MTILNLLFVNEAILSAIQKCYNKTFPHNYYNNLPHFKLYCGINYTYSMAKFIKIIRIISQTMYNLWTFKWAMYGCDWLWHLKTSNSKTVDETVREYKNKGVL